MVENKENLEIKEEVAQVATAASNEDFDWAALESEDEGFAGQRGGNDFEKMYDNTLNTVQEKEVLEGTVISMNKREVVVDIGYKSDGIVSLNEFRYNPDLKVGDSVITSYSIHYTKLYDN